MNREMKLPKSHWAHGLGEMTEPSESEQGGRKGEHYEATKTNRKKNC